MIALFGWAHFKLNIVYIIIILEIEKAQIWYQKKINVIKNLEKDSTVPDFLESNYIEQLNKFMENRFETSNINEFTRSSKLSLRIKKNGVLMF